MMYIAVIESIVMYASCAWGFAKAELPRFGPCDQKVGRAIGDDGLILSKLLPLDIRVKKTAWVHKVKRGKQLDDTGSSRDKCISTNCCRNPLVRSKICIPELWFESVEDLNPTTMNRLAIVGLHIYTDGS
ncbi:hypothetical protein EVAR_74472_1 [Eumeta japonica]|uniref:Uncharacterized protein n=1 Tax=Eumeta variegata TaxID=151549 RepID=A0A4C1TEE6_EUMVA|nr:hypothetical protein EVAR_74472_1 [Eumeta japonica]